MNELHQSEFWEEEGVDEEHGDLRIEVKLKNNILWRAIFARYRSISAFCRAHGSAFSPGTVSRLLNFKDSPFTEIKSDDIFLRVYKETCLAIAAALRLPVEMLFPDELYTKFVGAETNKAIEVSSFAALPLLDQREFLALPAPETDLVELLNAEELKERIREVLKTLPGRAKEVLNLRFGLDGKEPKTLEEVARVFGVTRELIRQIEMRALRKLREPLRAGRLMSFVDE